MIKRIFDVSFSLVGLLITFPIIVIVSFLIWVYDRKTPIYIAPRVGKNFKIFNIIKLRTMVVDADKAGINSTGDNDLRIIPIGKKIRRYKLDELTQLWNVFLGEMSFVGPRPNVKDETDLYTNDEKKLLSIKPGITDFSSIIFSDEGTILKDKKDPNLAYMNLIRPWKSKLGLIYIKNQSILLDTRLIIYTIINVISRKNALKLVCRELEKLEVDKNVIEVCKRNKNVENFILNQTPVIK